MASQIILITGATGGIGRCAALELAKAGHRVIATGRRASALDELKAEAKGTSLDTVVLDVTDSTSIAVAKNEVDRLTGGYGIDALVNNAGYGAFGALEEIQDSELRAQFETNVFGLMAVTRAFLPAMRERRYGRIINISSIAGRVTAPMMGAYHASKYAVEALSDALRNEVSRYGVRVVLIEPGAVRTEFNDRAVDTLNEGKPAKASPYSDAILKFKQLATDFDRTAVTPIEVVRVIERAITAYRPAPRYVVPGWLRAAVVVASALPTRIVDVILRVSSGLTMDALPAPTAQADRGPALVRLG